MAGAQSSKSPPTRPREPSGFTSARRSVQERLSARFLLTVLGAFISFLVVVGLVMYFKPGSTAEPSGKPALDLFGAGPVEDFLPGSMTLFEKEHIFLVRMQDGVLLALYDLAPHNQALVGAGDLKALECRAVLRQDAEMTGWLSAAGAPAGFEARGIWDECSDTAWDATGQQVRGSQSGSLDRFPVEIIDGIMRVNLGARECANPVTPETPCIVTQ